MRHYRFAMTCCGCPEQYDVWDDEKDIKVGYVRYRWGYLSVNPYLPEKCEITSEWSKKTTIDQKIDWETTIYDGTFGSDYDGIIPDDIKDQVFAVIDHKIFDYWNGNHEQKSRNYKPYIDLLESGEI